MSKKQVFDILQDLIYGVIPVRNKDYSFLQNISNLSIVRKYKSLDGFKTYFSILLENNSMYEFCILKENDDLTVYNIKNFTTIRNVLTTKKEPVYTSESLYDIEFEFMFHGEVVQHKQINDLIELVDAVVDIPLDAITDDLKESYQELTTSLADNREMDISFSYKDLVKDTYKTIGCFLISAAFMCMLTVIVYSFTQNWLITTALQLPILYFIPSFFMHISDLKAQKEEYECLVFRDGLNNHQKALIALDNALEERLYEVE